MTFDAEALMVAMAGFLDLTVAEEYRAGVVLNLQAAQRIAGPLLDWPLADEVEAAPVFQACPVFQA